MQVYFSGSFWEHKRHERPCRSLGIRESFRWKGCDWILLEAYVCKKGLVLDFAKRVPIGVLREFQEKWGDTLEKRWEPEMGERLTLAEREYVEYENPLETTMNVKAWVNQRKILSIHGCGSAYVPNLALDTEVAGPGPDPAMDASMEEAEELLGAYGLDKSQGWYFYRMTLEWDYRKTPEKLKLRLLLLPDSYNLPCEPFFETYTGEKEKMVSFFHPVDKTRHTLVVESVTQEKLGEDTFQKASLGTGGEYVYPLHFQNLRYHMKAPEDAGRFLLRDAEEGDAPVRKEAAKGTEAFGAAARGVGLIGGHSGPVSIFVSGSPGREAGIGAGSDPKREYQASRLCFQPVEHTRWQVEAVVSRGEEKLLEWNLEGAGEQKE